MKTNFSLIDSSHPLIRDKFLKDVQKKYQTQIIQYLLIIDKDIMKEPAALHMLLYQCNYNSKLFNTLLHKSIIYENIQAHHFIFMN